MTSCVPHMLRSAGVLNACDQRHPATYVDNRGIVRNIIFLSSNYSTEDDIAMSCACML